VHGQLSLPAKNVRNIAAGGATADHAVVVVVVNESLDIPPSFLRSIRRANATVS